jgi:hypothetical protein
MRFHYVAGTRPCLLSLANRNGAYSECYSFEKYFLVMLSRSQYRPISIYMRTEGRDAVSSEEGSVPTPCVMRAFIRIVMVKLMAQLPWSSGFL